MSTSAHATPLYAVPPPAPPGSTIRFALLLRARNAASQLFDRALAAPRTAVGYVLRHLRTVAAALPGPVATALGWVGQRLAAAAALVRHVGTVPLVGAVLTVPVVQRAVIALLSHAGRIGAGLATATWGGTAALLGRCGPVGRTVAARLGTLRTRVRGSVQALQDHPDARLVAQAGKAAAGLAGHIVRALAVHRTLRHVLPGTWLRVLVEAILLPLLLDQRLATRLRGALTNAYPAHPAQTAPEGAGVRVMANATASAATEGDAPLVCAPADQGDVPDVAPAPQNRAERREQQRDQAQAKRARTARR